ncbi:MAG: Holliday junction resolvase RuvX [Oscillospiraceae bacterium]|jgi:putative Holliday junction resolvase|nr:Holliday junction resolvase RuvX [Oscillospiraceae bacterium]
MRVMAVDYGDTRTGVAVSDATRTLCADAFTVTEKDAGVLAKTLAAEAAGRGAEVVVLGNPINMNGTAGPRSEKTAKLKALLEKRGCKVVLWDERRTTVEAGRILTEASAFGAKRKGKVDAVAASLILDGFLLFCRQNLAEPDEDHQDPEADS